MKYILDKIGQGKPNIAIVACVHGDEPVGLQVIKQLKKTKLNKGSLHFLIANQEAMKKNKRYIYKDLNRIFPGKKTGRHEEILAYELSKLLPKFDLVIDVHATNSPMDRLAIITQYNKKIKNILKKSAFDKVALMGSKIASGKSLIDYSRLGLSIEYGFGKTGKNYPLVLKDIKTVLVNLEMLPGRKRIFTNKVLYKVFDIYKVKKNFKPSRHVDDFQLIKKGEIIGNISKEKIKADYSFYPLFSGKGRYKETLALAAKKSIISLK